MSPIRAALMALLAAAAMAGPATAQTEPAAEPGTTAEQPAQPGPTPARVEKQIGDLHRRLHITAAQQPEWDAFAAVMRANAMHTIEMAKALVDAGSKTAVDEMKALAANAQARAADVQRLVPPFEALYATMSPDQRKLADTAMRDFVQRGARNAARP